MVKHLLWKYQVLKILQLYYCNCSQRGVRLVQPCYCQFYQRDERVLRLYYCHYSHHGEGLSSCISLPLKGCPAILRILFPSRRKGCHPVLHPLFPACRKGCPAVLLPLFSTWRKDYPAVTDPTTEERFSTSITATVPPQTSKGCPAVLMHCSHHEGRGLSRLPPFAAWRNDYLAG